jgi:hypothetical protein
MSNVKWSAILNNGEVVKEGDDFEVVSGESTPWIRFCQYLEDKQLEVKGLSLCIRDGLSINLPSDADYYALEYRIEAEIDGSGRMSQENFVVASAFKDDKITQLDWNVTKYRGTWRYPEKYIPMAPTKQLQP